MAKLIDIGEGLLCLCVEESDIDVIKLIISRVFGEYKSINHLTHETLIFGEGEVIYEFDGANHTLTSVNEGGSAVVRKLFSELA